MSIGRFGMDGGGRGWGSASSPDDVGFSWGDAIKLGGIGFAIVLAAQARRSGRADSSIAPVQQGLPWASYLMGGAAAAPLAWKAGESALHYLDNLPPPETPTLSTPVVPQGLQPPRVSPWIFTPPAPVTEPDSPTPTLPAESDPPVRLFPVEREEWLRAVPHPSVAAIVGGRGGGKTAAGYWILEVARDHAAPYVVGLPEAARKFLPDSIGAVDRLEDVPTNAVALIDEAYLAFNARNAMTRDGRDIGSMINLSRQKAQSLFFVVQEARQLDVNIVAQLDALVIKESTEISRQFERPELRVFTDRARAAFATVQGDRRQWSWVHSERSGFAGLLRNPLPSFWRPALSRAFGRASSSTVETEPGPPRKGHRTPPEELARKAREMRRAGFSYGQISESLGISKSTAWKFVNGDGPSDPQQL